MSSVYFPKEDLVLYSIVGLGGWSLIFLGIYYIRKVYQTSKSLFAYKVMAFTTGFGFQ